MKSRATFLIMLAFLLSAVFATTYAHHWATTLVCDSGVQVGGKGFCIFRKDPSPVLGFNAYEMVWYQDTDRNGRYSGGSEVIRVRPFLKPAGESISCPTAPTRSESRLGRLRK